MTPSPLDPGQSLFGYAPGNATIICSCCSAVAHNVDQRAIQCHACAVKLFHATPKPFDAPRMDWHNRHAPLDPSLAQFVRLFADRLNGAGDEPAPPPARPPQLAIGKQVRFQDGRVGIVCADGDPERSGTYTSQKYGPIPIKLLPSRAARRKAAHNARRGR